MLKDEALLDAAARVLADNRGASLVQVATGVGISRATLSRRYPTREVLIRAVAARAIDVIDERLAATDLPDDADAAVFDAALERLIADLAPAVDLYGFTAHDGLVLADPVFRAGLERHDQRALRFVTLGQRLGRLRGDLPPYWIWYMLWGLLDAAAEGVRDGHLGHREIRRLVSTVFRNGAEPPDASP
ncbi:MULTISPECIES: TetR/AcrR family transcriptional regulator [unclassified Streptomyces]|uniref:TetR/AcrR family transcriptional regulator n=1 Tax=Streptomyces sp. NBC_00060 TaxID=2975636 RepID=A0AAU2GT84_9ACTN